MKKGQTVCPLCEREVGERGLTEHHVKLRRRDARERVWTCGECHKAIHGLYPGTVLARRSDLWTVDGLLADAAVAKAVAHIRKLPVGQFMRMKQRRSS